MMVLRVDDAGDLTVDGISPLHADTLLQIPAWLQSTDPRVRERLLPEVYEDAEREEEWRKYATPELEHLFASRADLLVQDLQTLKPSDSVTFRMTIPKTHIAAWISSLNAARLAVFALHELEAEDMEVDPTEIEDFEKELALVRIHILALMQEMLLELG